MAELSFDDALIKLTKVTRRGPNDATARCPAHADHTPSLSVTRGKNGNAIFKCWAGCDWKNVVLALGGDIRGRGVSTPARNAATLQRLPETSGKQAAQSVAPVSQGCTLAQYAEAKKLPLEFLQSLGLCDMSYMGNSAVRIVYLVPGGQTVAVRFRIALDAKERFRWKSGDKTWLYGLWRLDTKAAVALVEGESDCHTLWHHGINAVGIPGATNWREDRDALHLADCERIDVVIEPDKGGDSVLNWIEVSSIRDRVWLVSLGEHKDASSLHVDDPDRFKERWTQALELAEKWSERQAVQRTREAREALARCADLAKAPNILDRFAVDVRTLGLIGEEGNAKFLFLAVVSRFFKIPISVAVKGPSSGGKSFLVETVLSFFPGSAFYALTAMSERALAYSDEPLMHRFLVIYEATGFESDFQSYLIRSLLSEGCIRYETVEKTSEGMKPRLIEREGPTGLLVTTTATRLHPENETRLISLTVTDSQEQTRKVIAALADEALDDEPDARPDLGRWHALQDWLSGANHRVIVPFATELGGLVPPAAVRLRRDIKAVLNLVRAHALLHQASRELDQKERIMATIDDYAVVHGLVAKLVSDGVEATVPATVRETVTEVTNIIEHGDAEVSQAALSKQLKLDRSPTSRRVRAAIDRGYLKNNETKRGLPARLVLQDPMPEDAEILPSPARLTEVLRCCSVAGGDRDPPSPLNDGGVVSDAPEDHDPVPEPEENRDHQPDRPNGPRTAGVGSCEDREAFEL